MRDEIERARQRMRLVGGMGSGQRDPMGCQHEYGNERKERQQRERRAKSGMVDAEADDKRPGDRRCRIPESQQSEVADAQFRAAHFAGRVLRRHLERHE